MAYLTRALVHHIQPVDTSRNKRIKLKIEKLKNKNHKNTTFGGSKIRDKTESWQKLVKVGKKSAKMANLAIQSLAYFFILLGGFLMVVAVILPFWKEPDYEVE